MPDLLLNNLQIDNFRSFDHLEIENLGRVNLITGKNNVGKSSLLEALWLYARRGSADVIKDLLIYRDEVPTQERNSSKGQPVIASALGEEEALESIKYLFHDYYQTFVVPPPIYIGSIYSKPKRVNVRYHNDYSVYIELNWYDLQDSEDEDIPRRYVKIDAAERSQYENPGLYFFVRSGDKLTRHNVGRLFSRFSTSSSLSEIRNQFVKTDGLSAREASTLWNDIQLTDGEHSVLEAIRLIAPNVERISVRNEQTDAQKPIPIIRLKGQDAPLPLRSLGDGINRIFGLTLAMINSKGGMLLIDEIENGLHYSVFDKFWRFIFEAAAKFDVQVFATTHSSDCVKSFQKAAQEDSADGFLVRLKERQGTVDAMVLDEDDLAVARRSNVEVR